MDKVGDHSAPWGLWKLIGQHACWVAGDLENVVAWQRQPGELLARDSERILVLMYSHDECVVHVLHLQRACPLFLRGTPD